jgi:hypothetical protein
MGLRWRLSPASGSWGPSGGAPASEDSIAIHAGPEISAATIAAKISGCMMQATVRRSRPLARAARPDDPQSRSNARAPSAN